jgi:hypothetical protein
MDRKTTLTLVVGFVMCAGAADALAAQQPVVALSQGTQVRVTYSHVVRGSSAITNGK